MHKDRETQRMKDRAKEEVRQGKERNRKRDERVIKEYERKEEIDREKRQRQRAKEAERQRKRERQRKNLDTD